jgi:hypothetical protein
MLTAMAGVTVIIAAAVFAEFAAEVAVSVTVGGAGILVGAVYLIDAPDALAPADKVPQALPLQPVPDSAQVTPRFCESFCTVAAKVCVPPTGTLAVSGDNVTTMAVGFAVIVIVAAADLVLSLTEAAVSVTVAGAGTFAGAV